MKTRWQVSCSEKQARSCSESRREEKGRMRRTNLKMRVKNPQGHVREAWNTWQVSVTIGFLSSTGIWMDEHKEDGVGKGGVVTSLKSTQTNRNLAGAGAARLYLGYRADRCATRGRCCARSNRPRSSSSVKHGSRKRAPLVAQVGRTRRETQCISSCRQLANIPRRAGRERERRTLRLRHVKARAARL
jgi:hypothetical protein